MPFTWAAFRRELGLAAGAVRARGAIVFAVSLPVAFLVSFNDPRWNIGMWAFVAGLVLTTFLAAWAMRLYAPHVGLPVGEPPRTGSELLLAGIITSWPLLVVSVLEAGLLRVLDTALRAFGTVAPTVTLALATTVVIAASLVYPVQGWAFSYVAVDGATARDATMCMVRAFGRRDVFVRAVLLMVLIAALDVPSYAAAVWLGMGAAARIVETVIGTLTTAIAYTFFLAALLTTRPPVPSLLAVPWAARETP